MLVAAMLYVGAGPRGSNGARFTLLWISVFHSDTHNQIGPLWCWLLSGWACAHSRPLWVSPMISPVRLGVSPAAAPTPTGTFNQRSEALFARARALDYSACFAPHHSSRFICARVWGTGCYPPLCLPHLCHSESGPLGLSVRECGATGSASVQTACPVRPTLRQSWSRHGKWSPLLTGCPSPPFLPVWMNVYFLFTWCRSSLPFDFPSVLFVRGGSVCLPTPPSWFSPRLFLISLSLVIFCLLFSFVD